MNDTKWLELQNAVKALMFPLSYILRCITDNKNTITPFLEVAQWWIGNWSNYYYEGMPVLFNIKWIKVRPQLSLHRGRLIKDEIIDETESFRNILNRLNIAYEEKVNIFTINGYTKI